MGVYIGNRVAHSVMRHVGNSDPIVTVLGVTLKENVPDIRNTRVLVIVHQLEDFGICTTRWPTAICCRRNTN
jgi:UDP-N-acetyl-D-glucosamine/UDP-N-acetyl-D-galactosamine dehydrogenase